MTAALRAWAPAVLWAALIFVASSQPTIPVDLQLGTDKLAHFAVYAALGVALGRGQSYSQWPWGAALALGLVYAGSDEFHQSMVPGRSADAWDWVADALGVATGLFLFHRWRRQRPVRARRRASAAANSSPT